MIFVPNDGVSGQLKNVLINYWKYSIIALLYLALPIAIINLVVDN